MAGPAGKGIFIDVRDGQTGKVKLELTDVVVTGMANRAGADGGKGLVFEDADRGSLRASVAGTATANNDDGDGTGIEAVQEDGGIGALVVGNSSIEEGVTAEDVEVEEN